MSTREEFEKWAKTNGFDVEGFDAPRDFYPEAHADVAWKAWQAATRVERESRKSTAPIFWYRPRSDGGCEEEIHDPRIKAIRENIRKKLGSWIPLYVE